MHFSFFVEKKFFAGYIWLIIELYTTNWNRFYDMVITLRYTVCSDIINFVFFDGG